MALDSVEWSSPISGYFTIRDDPTVTIGKGGWVGLRLVWMFWAEKSLLPQPRIKLCVIQPTAQSLY